ncbi:type II secretion system protein J [Gryllotalpicola reticulitermitis]|uniref:Type II secretion system protein J n=1 Tax=Gryllotalpicola reticulitermitis TaxID=1184153 RepID=A0ABV8Q1V5_9MICO
MLRLLRTRLRHAAVAEGGFTLIELMIYSALLLVVLMIVGGLMANVQKAGDKIEATNGQTTDAQQVATVIRTMVSNASALSESFPQTTASSANPGGDVLIMARTQSRSAPAPDQWECVAWFYDSVGHAIYQETSDTAIAFPTGGPSGSWTMLAHYVAPSDTTQQAITASANSVTLNLSLSTRPGAAPATIQTVAYIRGITTPVSAPCF